MAKDPKYLVSLIDEVHFASEVDSHADNRANSRVHSSNLHFYFLFSGSPGTFISLCFMYGFYSSFLPSPSPFHHVLSLQLLHNHSTLLPFLSIPLDSRRRGQISPLFSLKHLSFALFSFSARRNLAAFLFEKRKGEVRRRSWESLMKDGRVEKAQWEKEPNWGKQIERNNFSIRFSTLFNVTFVY